MLKKKRAKHLALFMALIMAFSGVVSLSRHGLNL